MKTVIAVILFLGAWGGMTGLFYSIFENFDWNELTQWILAILLTNIIFGIVFSDALFEIFKQPYAQ